MNLPNSLEYIKFGHNFSQSVDYLPSSLIEIIFGDNFNYTIDNLPSNITYIELGNNFKHPINSLPITLKKLVTTCEYYNSHIQHLNNLILSNKFTDLVYTYN